jgi:hypothetical protein
MTEILLETIRDNILILPFLFLTYLVIEAIETRAGSSMQQALARTHRAGPIIGAVAGLVPQCGFSAAAASLYAGGVITCGTLIAVLLSTSDEMLPILISESVAPGLVLRILGAKMVAALLVGSGVDWFLRRRGRPEETLHIDDLCEHSHCSCHERSGILRPALIHTLEIFAFLFVVSLVLNWVVAYFGEEELAALILNRPVIGELLSGLIGLIPNCAASVVITKLYLAGGMRAGAMLSGLLVGSGVGLLVLFRTNRNWKDNLTILAILYASGVILGGLMGLLF